jgi:Beta-galactosidase trimerisation domain
LCDAIPAPSVNGIYVSRTAALFTFAAGRSDALYAASLYGAYRDFFRKRIPVRFLHADRLPGAYASGLRTLYVPAALALSRDEQRGLIDFASLGGTLVLEAATGLFDQSGTIQPESYLMGEIAGLKGQILENHDRVFLEWVDSHDPGKRFSGRHYKQWFRFLEPDLQVLGRFETGEPAVCSRTVSNGQVVWVGTFCAAAISDDAPGILPITRWAWTNGYREIRSVTAPPETLIRLHRATNGELGIVAINYAAEPAEIGVALSGAPGNQTESKIMVGARDGTLVWLVQTETA